jgi:hypothetical protein
MTAIAAALPVIDLEPARRLRRDIRTAMTTLTPKEARFLVDAYYTVQDYRTQAANQERALTADGEPAEVIGYLFDNFEVLESQLKRALDAWTDTQELGRRVKTVYGIGPVIAAGLLAHIDITKAPTAGHIWRFAGLDPSLVWAKGQKRPFNAKLKVLCWKAGDSFVKFHNRDECVYGHLYAQRKAIEVAKNDAGDFADQAARILTEKKIGKETDAYKAYSAGTLPPAHIDARARRWAVKLFLAHYQEVAWTLATGTPPADPYPISILGHGDRIRPAW